jgi:nucleoside-diphosphate-sugar epimerase
MRISITGAQGFLGRALVRQLAAEPWPQRVLLVDRLASSLPNDRRFAALDADLSDANARRDLLAEADCVIHLAAVPGGAAEADYDLSRRVNLEATLDLADEIAALGRPVRLVYASSIAVFGAPLPPRIDDETAPRPALTYGAHKLMVEIALSNLTRLGRLDALALRLPGLAARPGVAQGLRSAFLSDIFHAVSRDAPYTTPVSADATVWLMSVRRAAENLALAARLTLPAGAPARALTLPALRIRVGDLVAEVMAQTGASPDMSYEPDPGLEAQFGALPPLSTPLAEGYGFRHDGDLRRLVGAVLADLTEGA